MSMINNNNQFFLTWSIRSSERGYHTLSSLTWQLITHTVCGIKLMGVPHGRKIIILFSAKEVSLNLIYRSGCWNQTEWRAWQAFAEGAPRTQACGLVKGAVRLRRVSEKGNNGIIFIIRGDQAQKVINCMTLNTSLWATVSSLVKRTVLENV